MVPGGTHIPFRSAVIDFLTDVIDNCDQAILDLRERNPIRYHKLYIRAFLNYTSTDLDNMDIQELADCLSVISELKKFWHLPFMDRNAQ